MSIKLWQDDSGEIEISTEFIDDELRIRLSIQNYGKEEKLWCAADMSRGECIALHKMLESTLEADGEIYQTLAIVQISADSDLGYNLNNEIISQNARSE